MQGKIINGFELKNRLGVGGMAEVWYAENEIHMSAAVKILNRDLSLNDSIVERFRNEAEIMVKLHHPNIRQVLGYGSIDGRPAIIMEYLEGDDLKARMKKGQRFTNEELKKWWNQLVDALKYTHEEGIVHRDIKPGNIFIDKKGNVKLLDFGIAKVRESISSTQTGQKLGTLMYMSPEQVRDSKHLDYHTDLYSLAVTFVHLLTGKKPYDSDSISDYDIQTAIVTKPLDLNEVPSEWKGFLEPYLEKDPAKRPELRYFEVVKYDNKDEETIVDSTPRKAEYFESLEHSKNSEKPKKKSKLGLWIALAVAAIAIGVAVLVFSPSSVTKESEAEANAFSNKTFTVNGITFEMIAVKGGTFTMGGTAEQGSDAESDEKPTHSVTLSDYYIGKFEVTQELWQAVMGNNPSYFKGNSLPVEQVSWNDVQTFITKLNQKTDANFRLPTEAEWEYAARGGNKSHGYKYSGSNNIGYVVWYTDNSGSKTHQVGTCGPNELGIYDMSGNVWEWCEDWYGPYLSYDTDNPKGASSGSDRVLRGGGWYYNAKNCRVSWRYCNTPGSRDSASGFRVVLH